MTNEERLKSLSKEELADFFEELISLYCPANYFTDYDCTYICDKSINGECAADNSDEPCHELKDDILNWLAFDSDKIPNIDVSKIDSLKSRKALF